MTDTATEMVLGPLSAIRKEKAARSQWVASGLQCSGLEAVSYLQYKPNVRTKAARLPMGCWEARP